MQLDVRGDGSESDSLSRLNPLTKLLAVLPAMGSLLVVTDPYTPLAFVVTTGIITAGLGRLSPLDYLRILLPFLGITISFVFVYPFIIGNQSDILVDIGLIAVHRSGLRVGAATGVRILALSVLSLLFVTTTDTESFLRALVQNLGVPYRIGYSAMAAFRFAPMIQSDLETVRAVHTVRGAPASTGLRNRLRQAGKLAMPLFVNAIRRAERTASAMDVRAFGAYDDRTRYRSISFGTADLVFLTAFWLLSATIIWLSWRTGTLGTVFG